MLTLSVAPTQDRLNAAVYECIRLRVCGAIAIPITHYFDIDDLMEYLERRFQTMVATFTDDGSVFSVYEKLIEVHTENDFYLTITPMKSGTSSLSSHPEDCAYHTPCFQTERS